MDSFYIITDQNTQQTLGARVKFTVSKARATFGYNICTLYVEGKQYAQCKGGGYDMVGTVFAKYLQGVQQDKLLALKPNVIYRIDKDANCEAIQGNGLYGLNLYEYSTGERKATVDGACGLESVKIIAEAIGVNIRRSD